MYGPFMRGSTEEEMPLSLVQVMSAVLFIGLMRKDFWECAGINFHDRREQKRYVDHLLKRCAGA